MPGAPVVVVGTHCDSIPQQRLAETLKHLNSQFQKMFLNSEIDKRAYPNIHPKCFFVSSKDGTNINSLREELHEFALSIKPSGNIQVTCTVCTCSIFLTNLYIACYLLYMYV